LDRALFNNWGWSSGQVLVLVLTILQSLAIQPLRGLKLYWSLNDRQAVEMRHAWRWISSSWIHVNGLEACQNLLLLLVLLGDSPLPLGEVILRYCLTSLACQIPAAFLAKRFGVTRRWSGASAPVSALIALAAGGSILHWQPIAFKTPLFAIPAWVMLLVVTALELSWQLPRQGGDRTSLSWQRLISSPWAWGMASGLLWAVLTRIRELF